MEQCSGLVEGYPEYRIEVLSPLFIQRQAIACCGLRGDGRALDRAGKCGHPVILAFWQKNCCSYPEDF